MCHLEMSPHDHIRCYRVTALSLWFLLISWAPPFAPSAIDLDFTYPALPHFFQLHPLLVPNSGNTETEKKQQVYPTPLNHISSHWGEGLSFWVSLTHLPLPPPDSCPRRGATFPPLTSMLSFSINVHFWISRCLDSQLENPKREAKL